MKTNDNGFVSLFTCIMISLLLLVITISLVSIEALQLRKAADSEQTLRAYYTAEAGVEDAVGKVLSKTIAPGLGDNICNSSVSFDASGASGWTCQQVSFSGNPEGKLDSADASKTIDPGATVPHYSSVIVQWNQSLNPAPAFYSQPALMAGAFPTGAAYNAVPPLEISMLEYQPGGFAASQVCTNGALPVGCVAKLQNMVIVPEGASPSTITYGSLLGHGPWAGNCGKLGRAVAPLGGTVLNNYNCYAVITGFPVTQNYLFRIRSRYAASSYKLSFKTGAGGAGVSVPVPDGTATIDVTAKAGQTYRRVISKLPLNNSAASGLNFVIYSDTDVCKNFDVFDNVASAPPSC